MMSLHACVPLFAASPRALHHGTAGWFLPGYQIPVVQRPTTTMYSSHHQTKRRVVELGMGSNKLSRGARDRCVTLPLVRKWDFR